ncbi:hypothetical protein GW17_00054985 [Ensete ventricosum]|nr:hypothetical protein GW17_00054985 [Ensete ventricosum]
MHAFQHLESIGLAEAQSPRPCSSRELPHANPLQADLGPDDEAPSHWLNFSAVSRPEHLNYALLFFRLFTPRPNLCIYNIMISALSFSPGQSFDLYKCMLSSDVDPNEKTFLSLKIFHQSNSLVKMYLDGGDVASARQVFDQMPEHDVVSCNIMLSGLARQGCSTGALRLFGDMQASGIKPDADTIVGLLTCCGLLKDVRLGSSRADRKKVAYHYPCKFHRRSRPLCQLPLPTAAFPVNAVVCKSPSCSRRTILTPVAASVVAGTPTASRSSTSVSTPSQLLASSIARADQRETEPISPCQSNDADFRRWLLHLLLLQSCPFHLKRITTSAHPPPVVTTSCCRSL